MEAPPTHSGVDLIKLEKLSIGYEGRPVFSDISLSVKEGSFTAILGANGSGKSTLLKTLVGLQPPLGGSIRFRGGAGLPVAFGYVPQSAQLDPLYRLTGFEVAVMGLYGRIGPGRFVPASERTFVRECLKATGAQDFARQWFSELSGGQKQRVLIARALATKPDVLVLDEPTAGVDTAATRALLEFISKIHEDRRLTILLVTHDLPLVRKHAQQVIWLHDGKIFQGTATELLSPERMAEVFEIEIG
jgi:ABC-type Mn2+/Zn2+ transport system ATPase subunit